MRNRRHNGIAYARQRALRNEHRHIQRYRIHPDAYVVHVSYQMLQTSIVPGCVQLQRASFQTIDAYHTWMRAQRSRIHIVDVQTNNIDTSRKVGAR